jgi:predicted ferric reductase
MQKLTGPAHFMSEWAFYIMVALVAVALLTLFAYWFFALTHRLFNLIYLALVFHTAVLFTATQWITPSVSYSRS